MPITNEVWALLNGPSVLDLMSKDPTQAPGKVAEQLFSKKAVKGLESEKSSDPQVNLGDSESASYEKHKRQSPQLGLPEDGSEELKALLDRAATTGRFPFRPSDLYLKIYLECLKTLEADPLVGMCSPSLLPSAGVIQVSICSVIPDIIRHMADVIVQAQEEIFLATNYWEASSGAKVITDAFRILDKRIAERKGKKIVVKVMYDRGTPKQVIENHQKVTPEIYAGDAVKLPRPEEVPNLILEVINYHRPLVGTFHAKYMVVDRRVGVMQSNNIQDRVNVEMMTHLEGPIVEAMYDMALLSWHLTFDPPLPLLTQGPPQQQQFQFGNAHQHIKVKNLDKAAGQAREMLNSSTDQFSKDDETSMTGQGDGTNPATGVVADEEDKDLQKALEDEFGSIKSVTTHLNTTLQPDTVGDAQPDPNEAPFRPHIIHAPHDPVPMVLVNRKPRGTPTPGPVDNPQGIAWLAAFKYAQKKIFIQTPTFNAVPVIAAALEAIRRKVEVILWLDIGFNDAGEMLPMQGGTNEMVISKMYSELNDEEKEYFKVYWYTGKDMTRPINASKKQRNCHVKIMIVDDLVGIQGNGNQDTQSWFHSQEANVMLESAQIMKEWYDGLNANQNTLKYGRVQNDGIWRDKDGNPLHDTKGPQKGGILGTLKGFKGAIDRVRGEGGF